MKSLTKIGKSRVCKGDPGRGRPMFSVLYLALLLLNFSFPYLPVGKLLAGQYEEPAHRKHLSSLQGRYKMASRPCSGCTQLRSEVEVFSIEGLSLRSEGEVDQGLQG